MKRSNRTVRVTGPESRIERWYRINAKAIQGPDGLPLYTVTVIEDVTEVKRRSSRNGCWREPASRCDSNDYRTLDQVAGLVVPKFADWCDHHPRRRR